MFKVFFSNIDILSKLYKKETIMSRIFKITHYFFMENLPFTIKYPVIKINKLAPYSQNDKKFLLQRSYSLEIQI